MCNYIRQIINNQKIRSMEYEYDIFLSHNKSDKKWAEKLASDLERNTDGRPVKVFFDKWDIKPGSDIPDELERGLRSSKFIGLIMSPESLKSPWVALERSTAIIKDPSAKHKTLIPILRKKCDIPYMLQRINYIDFSDDSRYGKKLYELLEILRGIENKRGENISFDEINLIEDKKLLHDFKSFSKDLLLENLVLVN